MDLDSLLVSLQVLVDDWWKAGHSLASQRPPRPVSLSESEVLRLAILSQWPRFRSEHDFWRFAWAHQRSSFPNLVSQGQLNRRVPLEHEMRAPHTHLAKALADPSAVCHIVDSTPIPAMVRVRACRKGLFAEQLTFGRCRSKSKWVYGFKVGLSVSPEGVVCAFGLGEAASDERPIGDFLISGDRHDAYLADKGFSSLAWERHWLESYGALVAATSKDNTKRAWAEADRRWASGKRQLIEGVIN
jgi:hypothetical protein